MSAYPVGLLFALFATSALAQGYNRDDVVRGLCEPNGCDEFSILAADRIKTTAEGTLYRTRIQTFHASHQGRQERGRDDGFVYCSATKPAIMAEQNGKTMAFFLAPFGSQETRESLRKNANYHALYFTICHGREAGRAAVQNVAEVARSNGYRVTLARSNFVALKRAEDVITEGGRMADEGRPVQGPSRDIVNQADQASREAHARAAEATAKEERGLLAGARRFTNRAFDTLDEAATWATGESRK